MNLLITGGLGFIGRQLATRFLEKGNQVTIIDMPVEQTAIRHAKLRYLPADTTRGGAWQEAIAKQDVIINLAGASIFSRWTEQAKEAIYNSRVLTTRNVVEAIPKKKKVLLCSTSAVGYYGWRGDETLAEDAMPGDDFLARVCRDWESAALEAEKKGARVVITRFGIVLGKSGGALGTMLPLFRYFLGGRLGSGRQWFSWIHARDLVRGFNFILDHPKMKGAFNLCSPNPVTNAELTRALARVMRRPALFPAPAFAMKLVLGEFADNILNGQRVAPRGLLESGFTFDFPEIEGALRDILKK